MQSAACYHGDRQTVPAFIYQFSIGTVLINETRSVKMAWLYFIFQASCLRVNWHYYRLGGVKFECAYVLKLPSF
jgi:hypothetical protein